jgi:HK97 family phage prohead protease
MSALELRRRRAEDLHGTRERRGVDGQISLNATSTGRLGLLGIACRTGVSYEVGSVDSGGFRETVMPGSFQRTLANQPDVILVVQHGAALSGLPIARTSSGTLRLSETQAGLAVDADLDPEDPDVQALQRKFARGDLDGQMSFAFRVPPGGDSWDNDYQDRKINQCEINRGDVSVVSFGASPTTSSALVGRSVIYMPDYTTRARQRLAVMQRRLGVAPTTSPPARRRVAPAVTSQRRDYAAEVAAMRERIKR